MNLISERLVTELRLSSMLTQSAFKLVGVTGAPLQTMGVLNSLVITINGVDLTTNLLVTSKMNEDCILGQSFFEDHSMVLNFPNRTVGNHLVTAQLIESQPLNTTLVLKCLYNNLVSKPQPVICGMFDEEGNEVNSSGIYYLSHDPEFNILRNDHCDEHTATPLLIENGLVDIAISCDTDDEESAELWLPEGTVLGTVLPDVRSANMVETNCADGVRSRYGWKDDDPRRIDMIVEALGIEKNGNLNGAEKEEAVKLIAEFADVFALDRSELGATDMVYHEIPLNSDQPVQCPYRRVPFHLRADCVKEVQELLDAGIVQHSTSNYNSPAIILKRKGKTRIVIDFRKLNAISSRSYCSIPAINTITAGCHGRKIFSNLDMKDGFLQIPIKPEHCKYTAFAIPGVGFLEFVRMGLGLCGGPSTFQNLLDRLLEGLPPDIAAAYIDDILSSAYDVKGMINNLRIIFTRIRKSGLRFNPTKCQLFRSRIKFLGHYLSEEGIAPDHDKAQAIINMDLPKTRKQVQKLIGAASWFRPHIDNFGEKIRGLTATLKGDSFVLTDAAIESINTIKKALVSPPTLIYPSEKLEFVILTDASQYCIGGTIGHFIDKKFRPVAYASKILNETEQRYASYKREFLALKHFINFWRYYLINKRFTALVDMKAITYESFAKKTNSSTILRWIMELQDYDFVIKYREGRLMDVPDLLSRIPSKSDELYHWWVQRCNQNNASPITGPNLECEDDTLGIHTIFQSQDSDIPDLNPPVVDNPSTSVLVLNKENSNIELINMSSESLPADTLPSQTVETPYPTFTEPEHVSLTANTTPEVLSCEVTDCCHLIDLCERQLSHAEESESSKTSSTFVLHPDLLPLTGSSGTNTDPNTAPPLNSGPNEPSEYEKSSVITKSVLPITAHNALESLHQKTVQSNICPESTPATTPHDAICTNSAEAKTCDTDYFEPGNFEKPLPAYKSEVMKKLQENDPDLTVVKQWLKSGTRPSGSSERSTFSDALNRYWQLFEHLCLSVDDTICYKYFFSNSKKFRQLICIPSSAQKDLMKNHHDSESSGHPGPLKTLQRIREKYYFPNMTAEIKMYCNTCETCFLHNHGYQKKPKAPLKLFTASRPNQYLSIDLIGPINGPSRYKYILTMKDRFTKLVQLAPLINGSSPIIAKALLDNWIWKQGCPEQILSDRAKNLTGEVMKSVYDLLSIYKVQTTSYHARGNGDCERANKDISVILKKMVSGNPSSWPTKLNAVAFAMNNSASASTGFTPFRLHFAREIRAPADLIYDTSTTEFYRSGLHLAQTSYYEMRSIFDLVRANLHINQSMQKQMYDKKKGFHTTYKVGDLVLHWKPLSPAVKDYRKFRNTYSGPWKINKVLSRWTYLIQNQNTSKVDVVHFDTLKHIPDNLRKCPDGSTSPEKSPPDLPDATTGHANSEEAEMFRLMFGASTTNIAKANDHALLPDPDQLLQQEPDRRYDLRPRQPIAYSQ